MSPVTHAALSQISETPIQYMENGRFYYRYAYGRSADSRKNNEAGQDYLTMLEDGDRFVFALCDGVSQSFYGDIASGLLGENLLDFFNVADVRISLEEIRAGLMEMLSALTQEATQKVRDFPLPNNLPPLLAGVLDKKRSIGSESTFVAGVIDVRQNTACFCWMGDSRLRLWKNTEEITSPFINRFNTNERWSSVKGPVGQLQMYRAKASDFTHLMTYSDGLAALDKYQFTRFNSHRAIDLLMDDANLRPASDDVSFLELWLNSRPNIPVHRDSKPRVERRETEEHFFLQWKRMPGATHYEARLNSAAGTLNEINLGNPNIKIDLNTLNPQVVSVQLRAWYDEEPGVWSEEEKIESTEQIGADKPMPKISAQNLPFPIFHPQVASHGSHPHSNTSKRRIPIWGGIILSVIVGVCMMGIGVIWSGYFGVPTATATNTLLTASLTAILPSTSTLDFAVPVISTGTHSPTLTEVLTPSSTSADGYMIIGTQTPSVTPSATASHLAIQSLTASPTVTETPASGTPDPPSTP